MSFLSAGKQRKAEGENGLDKMKGHLAGGEPWGITNQPTGETHSWLKSLASIWTVSLHQLGGFHSQIDVFRFFSPIRELQLLTLMLTWQSTETTVEIAKVFPSLKFV